MQSDPATRSGNSNTLPTSVDFLLLGGGPASASAAASLREAGANGSILLLAAEPQLPYHRPPLSKEYLRNSKPRVPYIRSAEFYAEQRIELRLGLRATGLDLETQQVSSDSGECFRYRQLLIATGCQPRCLNAPGGDLPGIHYLRTLADAEALRAGLGSTRQVVIIGSSFIAMEVAASCRHLEIPTTILANEQHVYDRLRSPEISEFFTDYYRSRGVQIIFGDSVQAFHGNDKVREVRTRGGRVLAADLVVLGVGVTPALDFLAGSGLQLDDGVVVDQYLVASDPRVFAAGDVARFYDPVFKRYRRIEHWDNAVKQGRLAARNMLGAQDSYRAVSWFYSEVFDLSFDFVGDIRGTQRREVRKHSGPESFPESFSVLYLRDDHLQAAFLLRQAAQEIRAAGALILNRTPLSRTPHSLTDSSTPLTAWARQNVLILQGGGALGAFECGVVKGIMQEGIYPDVVAGVSIGAFNAAIVASRLRDAPQALEDFWHELALPIPAGFSDATRRALAAWQALVFGVPKFFVPRWWQPGFPWLQWPLQWTSLYDPSPIIKLLRKHVDFSALQNSPVRLLLNAVNVETSELETFDSFIEPIGPDHLLASGSLPPGFPWTTIKGKHYWDGGIVSNSPLDQVVERCGLADKAVYIVNLYPARKALPGNLGEVLSRRDEIVYAEKVRREIRSKQLLENYRQLVADLLEELDADTVQRIVHRPLYLETVEKIAPLSITRFVHHGEPGETSAKDYEFSAATVQHHIEAGQQIALRTLREQAQTKAHPA